MSLPKIQTPIFNINIPSTNESKKFRPFLVKEEKLFLMAQQGSHEDILETIIQIINNCCLEDLDIMSLASYDLEYIFLKLRARSVNNIVELKYRDKEDEKIYTFEVNLDEIEVKFNENHTNTIKVGDELTIVLKSPGLDLPLSMQKAKTEEDIFYIAIMNCLDKVYTENDVFSFKEYSFDECKEFLDSLDVKTFENIQKFLKTMPKLQHTLSYTNSKGSDRKIELEGIMDFFP